MVDKPAILGGPPAFEQRFPLIRPSTHDAVSQQLLDRVTEVLQSGMLSNVAIHVREFEEEAKRLLRVDHVVAVSSCTSGLILALQALGVQKKRVGLPSFTFSATGHAIYWNQNDLRYIDIDDTLTMNPQLLDARGPLDALMPVHIYGNPCDVEALGEWAERNGVPVVFDAAHGLGSSWRGRPVGSFGTAEVFSLSPTKLITTGEGGLVATNDESLAERLRLLRNYGNKPDYTCDVPGLSARMSELNAVLGLEMILHLDRYVEARNRYVDRYRRRLSHVSGIAFQRIQDGAVSSHKDFGILVEPEAFGMDRDLLARALEAEGIMTKRYYYPPIHELTALLDAEISLPVTRRVSKRVLALPIHNAMETSDLDVIAESVASIHDHAKEIREGE